MLWILKTFPLSRTFDPYSKMGDDTTITPCVNICWLIQSRPTLANIIQVIFLYWLHCALIALCRLQRMIVILTADFSLLQVELQDFYDKLLSWKTRHMMLSVAAFLFCLINVFIIILPFTQLGSKFMKFILILMVWWITCLHRTENVKIVKVKVIKD